MNSSTLKLNRSELELKICMMNSCAVEVSKSELALKLSPDAACWFG